MWKINDYKIVNTNPEDNTTSTEQIPEVILDATKNTWWKVFELTHFGWFKDVIWIILWKKIDASWEIEKLIQFRQFKQRADDYIENEINRLTKYKQADDYNEQKAA
jgi:hypothetical protein